MKKKRTGHPGSWRDEGKKPVRKSVKSQGARRMNSYGKDCPGKKRKRLAFR